MGKKALILVDLQNDFFPGGALPAAENKNIWPAVHLLCSRPDWAVTVATKDWHPKNHISFASNHGKSPGEVIQVNEKEQILWPVHCVQNTQGSEFAPGWDWHQMQKIIYKGADPKVDSYSAFFDNNHQKSTGLHEFLQIHGIAEVYIAGMVTEYCVKYSALDAVSLGYATYVMLDGCRAAIDGSQAIEEMKAAGVKML